MSDTAYTQQPGAQPRQGQQPPQYRSQGQPPPQYRNQVPPQTQYRPPAQPQGRPQSYAQPRPQQRPQVQRISWFGAAKQFFYSKKIDKAGLLRNLTKLIVALRALGFSAAAITFLNNAAGLLMDEFVWIIFLVVYTPFRITWIWLRTNHPSWFAWLTR